MDVNAHANARVITGVLYAALLTILLWLSISSLEPSHSHAQAASKSSDNVAGSDGALQNMSTNRLITVTGQNDAEHDFSALETALDTASHGDIVMLEGIFDLSGCVKRLTLTKNVTLTGVSDPNLDPLAASQVLGCGPAFIVDMAEEAEGSLTIKNIYFRDQEAISIQLLNSVNPVYILDNRFTGNIPVNLNGTMARFAVGVAQVGPLTLTNAVTIEGNHIDWSDYPHNDTFEGDDNGFAFAAGNMSVIIRNNYIRSLGEAIEVEGMTGQDNTYLIEGNVVRTQVPPSPSGESSGPPNSVADGLPGGHPAAVKVHANEGTFVIRGNDVQLDGLPNGVCIMATTLNAQALAGELVNQIESNTCTMNGQLAAILGAWGQTQPFFKAASLSGSVVSSNVVSGTGSIGIAMISRTSAPLLGSVINNGHDNYFLDNDFSNFTATQADIGFDPQTTDNYVIAQSGDNIVDLGANKVLDQRILIPSIRKD